MELHASIVFFFLVIRVATLAVFANIFIKQLALLGDNIDPELVPTRNAMIAIVAANIIAQLIPLVMSIFALGNPALMIDAEMYCLVPNSITGLCAAVGFWLIYQERRKQH